MNICTEDMWKIVAVAFNEYIDEGCERICKSKKFKPRNKIQGPADLGTI